MDHSVNGHAHKTSYISQTRGYAEYKMCWTKQHFNSSNRRTQGEREGGHRYKHQPEHRETKEGETARARHFHSATTRQTRCKHNHIIALVAQRSTAKHSPSPC